MEKKETFASLLYNNYYNWVLIIEIPTQNSESQSINPCIFTFHYEEQTYTVKKDSPCPEH